MSYNVPIFAVSLFKKYLSNCSQQFLVDCSCSFKFKVLSGVSMGSILSPLLFILYTNAISTISLSSTYSFALYAKDIFVSCSTKSFYEFSLFSLCYLFCCNLGSLQSINPILNL